MADKQVKEMSLEEIAKRGMYDEALSYIKWNIYMREKKEIFSKPLSQLSKEFKRGKAVELLKQHIIEERNEAYNNDRNSRK